MSSSTVAQGRQSLTGIAVATIIAATLVGSPFHTARAQAPAARPTGVEFRITGGGLIATGSQRNFIKDAQVTAAQLTWVVRPSVAVTTTLGWARSRDIASAEAPKLDVFTGDVGIEVRSATWFAGRAVTFSPFIGAGGGARSYNYRSLDADATHNLAGYAAIGGELGSGRLGLRLEVRNYVTGFKPLVGRGETRTGNDVVMMVGLRFNRQQASSR